MHKYLLATGHCTQNCAWVQRVGVVAQNSLTHLLVLEFVGTDSRFARLMRSTKYQAWPRDNHALRHFIGLLP